MVSAALISTVLRRAFHLTGFRAAQPQLAGLIAVLAAGLSGTVYALLLAFASINLKAAQTIGGTALNMLAPAFAVVDLRLGDGNGLDVVSALKRKRPDARAIVPTGYGNIATAAGAAWIATGTRAQNTAFGHSLSGI